MFNYYYSRVFGSDGMPNITLGISEDSRVLLGRKVTPSSFRRAWRLKSAVLGHRLSK
jgi:hypothetical protein